MTGFGRGEMLRRQKIDAAIGLVKRVGARKRDEPVRLGTGELTWVYLDVKGVLTTGQRLLIAADAMLARMEGAGLTAKPNAITAIGGPTMGADVLAHTMTTRGPGWLDEWKWFSVRDSRKTDHGLGLWIEGARLDATDEVVLMDDVANSGNSLVEAYERVTETGAQVLAIMPLVDRSGVAEQRLRDAGITVPYLPVMDYNDLGLLPLGKD